MWADALTCAQPWLQQQKPQPLRFQFLSDIREGWVHRVSRQIDGTPLDPQDSLPPAQPSQQQGKCALSHHGSPYASCMRPP